MSLMCSSVRENSGLLTSIQITDTAPPDCFKVEDKLFLLTDRSNYISIRYHLFYTKSHHYI